MPEPVIPTPTEPHGIVVCTSDPEPHSLTGECVDPQPAEWTPGAGTALLRREQPQMVPDLTEEDIRKADEVIAQAGQLKLPLTAASTAELAERLREAMRHGSITILPPVEDDRERAAYARGISEGRRQAAEAIRAQAPGTSVIEGGPDLMAWAAELAECPRCPAGVCSAHRSGGEASDVH